MFWYHWIWKVKVKAACHFVNRQNIRPTLVNKALDKLKEVNPLYRGVWITETWESVSQENNQSLWNLLTNENSEYDSVDVYNAQENTKKCRSQWTWFKNRGIETSNFITQLSKPIILPEQAVNVAPGEGQIPVYHSSGEN